MKLLSKLKTNKLADLETIEEKSFWIVGIMVIVLGVVVLSTSVSYPSPYPTIFTTIFCLLMPLTLMLFVSKRKNYHTAYPMLCASTGAIALPICFVFSGGFLSGTLLFCVVCTSITVLSYSTKLRFTSLGLCILGNTIAFLYVYRNGSPYPLTGSESLFSQISAIHPIYNDMFFGYYLSSLAMFFAIHFIINDIRRYKINQDALQQFFDKEKRNEILRKVINDNLAIDSEVRKACIVFADISSFTTITENMSSELILGFLNEFFSRAGHCIHATGGIIDKFIGDCVMAYWLENEESNCVLDAVHAMMELKLELSKKAEYFYGKYDTELNFTVGIAYGEVILGDIGSDTMHDFTVIGDAVNVANRMESFAAGGEMLISENAAKMIRGKVELERVECDHFFKGKNKPTDLYRIHGLTPEKRMSDFIEHETYGYNVYVCGCRGSIPVSGLRFSEYGGDTSCYVVKKDDYAIVVDCGTGLKNAEKFLKGCKNIDILLTHVHYDHILGLLMARFPAHAKIRIFGHFNAWNSDMNTLEAFMDHPYWPVEIKHIETNTVEVGRKYSLKEDVSATFYPSDHPDDACVIKLTCRDKKLVFLFDCEKAESLPEEISQNSDLLFFDGMYDDKDSVDHTGWGHGTWQDAVRFLDHRNIVKLVVTHHDPALGDHSLMLREREAHGLKPNISFAKTGDVFYI